MIVVRRSKITGNWNSREIPVDEAKLARWDEMDRKGPFIQEYFPELSDQDREFILTGITSEEWASMDLGEE